MSALSATAIAAAAVTLGCDVATVRAVDDVESSGAGFDQQGRVKILFEPHLFHKQTGGLFGASHPELSYARWMPGAPSYKRDQHQVLAAARALVPPSGKSSLCVDDAAVMACSWGRYQILGSHWRVCGFRSVTAFEAAMRADEGEHLAAFVSFVRAHPGMHTALKSRSWDAFARAYNGPRYAEHGYHTRLAAAYLKHSKGGT